MADVKLNPVIESLRGKIGDLVFKKFFGETIVSRIPDVGDRPFTDAQKAVHEKFRQAATYGKMVMADAQARALYEQAAREKHKPVFSLMVADFFHSPTVDFVDLSEY